MTTFSSSVGKLTCNKVGTLLVLYTLLIISQSLASLNILMREILKHYIYIYMIDRKYSKKRLSQFLFKISFKFVIITEDEDTKYFFPLFYCYLYLSFLIL